MKSWSRGCYYLVLWQSQSLSFFEPTFSSVTQGTCTRSSVAEPGPQRLSLCTWSRDLLCKNTGSELSRPVCPGPATKKKMERGNKYLLWRWHGKFTKGRELVFKTGWNEQLKAKCHTVQMVLYLKKYSFAKWKRFRGLLHNIHRVKNGTLYCALKNGTFSYHNNNKKRIWAHHFLSLTSLL